MNFAAAVISLVFAAAAALAAPSAPPLSPTPRERTYDPYPERTTPRRCAAEASAVPRRPRQRHRHPSGASDVQLLRVPRSPVPSRALGGELVSDAGCRATRRDGSRLRPAFYSASYVVPFPLSCGRCRNLPLRASCIRRPRERQRSPNYNSRTPAA